MEIISLEIRDYKSVKKPLTVTFEKDKPTVFIGKNGSGKTNILGALNAVLTDGYSDFASKTDLSYKAKIKLSEEEFSKLFPSRRKEYDEECSFTAFGKGEKFKIDSIQSEKIVPLFKKETGDIRDIAIELKKEFEKYRKQLEKIACDDFSENSIRSYKICDFLGRVANYDVLKNQIDFIIAQTEEFTDKLLERFSADDESVFAFGTGIYFPLPRYLSELEFKLEYTEPQLAEFEKQYISVDETKIKRAITRINTKTAEICKKISELANEIKRRTEILSNVFESEQVPAEKQKYYKFLSEVQKCVSRKCLFLKNESSDVIFYDNADTRNFQARETTAIAEAYLKKVYIGEDREEKLSALSKSGKIPFAENDLESFERYLNENLPDFEKGMYDSVSAELSEDGKINIFLHEKTGEKTEFNKTSAGRRWYFTYYFMKSTLQEGDVFIIDEPAAMLHPIAQKEILSELERLANDGIRVIYTTHSPYLIPDDWRCVNFVFMGEQGTESEPCRTEKEMCGGVGEIIGNDIFTLEEIYLLYHNCDGDGLERLTKNCYNAVQKYSENFRIKTEGYDSLGLCKDTVKSWNVKGKNIGLENVILVAVKTKTEIKNLFS